MLLRHQLGFALIFSFGFCLLLTTNRAAGQAATMITLDQAVDLALAHNHALQANRTLILQNQAQEITANLRPNPTLDLIRSSFRSLARRIFLPTI